MLGLVTAVSDNSTNPDGNQDPIGIEVGISDPSPMNHTTTIDSITDPVRATAVEDIMTVEATKVNPETTLNTEQKPCICAAVVFGCVFTVAAIVISIVAVALTSIKSGDSTATGSTTPTSSPTLTVDSRSQALREILAPVSSNVTLYTKESAQYDALLWMANDFNGTNPEDYPNKVIQRYIMALLYFQTMGSNWTHSFNFLSPKTECQWTDVAEACDSDGLLTVIQITNNNMEGQFPTEITHLSRLQVLNLNTNHLTGTLPREIGNLISLKHIDLMENNIHGTIPTELYKLNALESVSLFRNSFCGTLDSGIGRLVNLKHLHVGANFLIGSLPDGLYNITGMLELDVRQNSVTGTISGLIADMSNLTSIVLFANSFNGTLPTAFGSLQQLTNMQVSDFALTGTFPSELGSLGKSSRLALSYNFFTGTLPREFIKLSSLKKLYLQNNDFLDDIDFMCDKLLNPFRVDLHEVNCTCCSCCTV